MSIYPVVGVGCLITGHVLYIYATKRSYKANAARLACIFYAIGLGALTYWATLMEEGILKTIVLVLGGLLTLRALLHVFKARPLEPVQ